MKRSLLVAWILLALGLPVTAQEESTLALKAAFPADLCASLDGFGGPGEPLLPIVVTVDPAAAGDSAQWDSLLGCGASRIQPVVLLEPPVDWQHAPDPYAALSGWLRDLEAFVAPRRGLVRVFQLGSRPELQFSARSYVYLLEKVGTLLHSIDPQATLLVGSIGDGAQAWLDEVDLHGLAPYVGGVALEDPIDLDAWAARMAREHPALRLWLYADASSTDPGAFILRYVRARAAGIQAVVATVAGPGGSELTNVVLNLVRWLPPRFIVEAARAAGGGAGGLPSENGRVLFFSDPLGSNEAIIALDPHQTSVEAGPYPVERVHAFDLVTGAALLAGARDPGSHGGRALIELPERVGPALIAFNMVKGPRGSPETVAVTERRALTVEEIIAGVQAFQAAQGRALDHYQAKATISYHYRAETLGQSIDVVSVNRLFWKAGTGEYEETDLFVNGARWRGKPPALPFIQAEKVREVPLEIRLDRSYDYRLRGEGQHPRPSRLRRRVRAAGQDGPDLFGRGLGRRKHVRAFADPSRAARSEGADHKQHGRDRVRSSSLAIDVFRTCAVQLAARARLPADGLHSGRPRGRRGAPRELRRLPLELRTIRQRTPAGVRFGTPPLEGGRVGLRVSRQGRGGCSRAQDGLPPERGLLRGLWRQFGRDPGDSLRGPELLRLQLAQHGYADGHRLRGAARRCRMDGSGCGQEPVGDDVGRSIRWHLRELPQDNGPRPPRGPRCGDGPRAGTGELLAPAVPLPEGGVPGGAGLRSLRLRVQHGPQLRRPAVGLFRHRNRKVELPSERLSGRSLVFGGAPVLVGRLGPHRSQRHS